MRLKVLPVAVLLIASMLACTKKEQVYGTVLCKSYTPDYHYTVTVADYEYQYGYNFMTGKFEYHNVQVGSHEEPRVDPEHWDVSVRSVDGARFFTASFRISQAQYNELDKKDVVLLDHKYIFSVNKGDYAMIRKLGPDELVTER